MRNAFKDLIDQLNQKLDSSLSIDRWQARIKATLTGRSEAEILLSEGAVFEIADLLLINRQSGLLLAKAGSDAEDEGMDSQLLGSILTAIMAFVRDAMHEASEQDLRTLHVGDMQLHLQVSPAVILAIKTKGPPSAGFDGALNETFCAFLSRWGNALSDPDIIERQEEIALADDLDERFRSLLQAKSANFRAASKKGAILLGGIALIAIGWLGWIAYDRWVTERIEATAREVIDSRTELIGYPLRVQYRDDLNDVVIAGLAPDEDVRQRLRDSLVEALPDTKLAFDVRALPRQSSNVDLSGLVTRDDLETWGNNLQTELTEAIDDNAIDLRTAIETVELALPAKSEREVRGFQLWLARQSLRFNEGSNFESEPEASSLLRELSLQLARLPDEIGLIVIGYADDIGGRQASDKISLERSEKVSRRLKNLGVASRRLVSVGRSNENRISQQRGPESANRRVEFELLFISASDIVDNRSDADRDHVSP
ncbi:MAG: OmpA family protein [Geminicoccaceae bacterium]